MVGGGFAAAGVAAGPVSAQYVDDAWLKGPAKRPLAPGDIKSAVQRLRKQFLAEFDPAYVENVIVPHFLVSIYDGERPYLPMIGVELTKENAIPYELWGLLSETWKPAPEKGVTVFLQGLEKRGPHNERQAHLHVGGHAGPVPPDVRRQGRDSSSTSSWPTATPASR